MKKLISSVLFATLVMSTTLAFASAREYPTEKSYYPTFLSLNGLTGIDFVDGDKTNQTRGTKYNVDFESERSMLR